MESETFYIGDIVICSGVRVNGQTVDMRKGRPSHGLLYLWNGEATIYSDSKDSFSVTGGQLLYLPKMLEYKLQYTGESTTFVVLNFDILPEGINPFGNRNDAKIIVNDDVTFAVANIMSKFEQCSAAQNMAGQFRRKELIYRLLSIVYSNGELYSDNGKYPPAIMKGVLLLKQTYLEDLPIDFFAKQSNISTSLFRQLFRKQYNMSPLQYRNKLRINRAKQLLECNHCTVAEVAYATGFENVGYFCRLYKRITGVTPTQTKESNI